MSHADPLPEYESPGQCPPATSSEKDAFYQELQRPTEGQTVIRQVMHKLLVFSAKEVDYHGDCLILQDMGISLFIPPGNSARLPSPHTIVQVVHCTRAPHFREHHA